MYSETGNLITTLGGNDGPEQEESCSGSHGENWEFKQKSKLFPLHCFHPRQHLRGQIETAQICLQASKDTFGKLVSQRKS